MAGPHTEANYENSVIELFENLGYRYVYGPDVDRDFHSPLYDVKALLHGKNAGYLSDIILQFFTYL